MNCSVVEGNWKQFRGRVTEHWGKLSDDHLDVIAGKCEVLVGRIQEAYGISKEQVEEQIRRFEERNKDYQPPTDEIKR